MDIVNLFRNFFGNFLGLALLALEIFFLFFLIFFYDLINQQVYDYFYSNFKKEFKKEGKIVGIYFSVLTFERMPRRYIKEFYFLEKFLSSLHVKYLIITDKNINLLDEDIDLLIVNDCRFIPISTIISFQDYSKTGKIIFTYQSLMFSATGKKYYTELYKNFGIYDINFVNRQYQYFSFKHFTKILLSRKYCVEYYTDKNNVLAWTSNNTPFLVNYGNYYFLAENTFTVENLSNPYIFSFNSYLLEMIVPGLIGVKKQSFDFSFIELLMPIEFIIQNPKTRKYFYFSPRMKIIYEQVYNAVVSRNFHKRDLVNKNNSGFFVNVEISRINKKGVIMDFDNQNFYVIIEKNKQNGIESYHSYRFDSIISEKPLILKIRLEDYICSVVVSEMPDIFELEALKAQAVAARTYAIKNKRRHKNFDLCDMPHCQNFEGENYETFKSFIATYSTMGQIIVYKDFPIDAVYHSTCGGITANSEDVWNKKIPYLRMVKDYEKNIDDAYCKHSPLFKWKVRIPKQKLEKILSKTIPRIIGQEWKGKLKEIKIEKNQSQRIEKMIIITDISKYVAYKDDSIYLISEDLYYSLLPSNFIQKVEVNGNDVIFEGRGFGHGVGLCQFGANELAKKFNYIQILKHYYSNVRIKLIENSH